ncbi:MAG: hypothetical protein U0401_09605 [Anaerolineae bacterium]
MAATQVRTTHSPLKLAASFRPAVLALGTAAAAVRHIAWLYRQTIFGMSSWQIEGWDSAHAAVRGSTWEAIPHSPAIPFCHLWRCIRLLSLRRACRSAQRRLAVSFSPPSAAC